MQLHFICLPVSRYLPVYLKSSFLICLDKDGNLLSASKFWRGREQRYQSVSPLQ